MEADGSRYVAESTGIKVQAVGKHHAELPEPVEGEHLWIVTGMWRVADPSSKRDVHLDTENLITLEGPGCYWCEDVWTPELSDKPCPGEPQRK